MSFNGVMTIWILAVLLMASVSLAGWRQGAIRTAFAFGGILFAALLAAPLGRLVHPLLPHLGVANPITAWALAPIIGFIVASIPLKVAGHYVHNRVEHFYKYNAGELRQALWERLNTRLGICLGILNGAIYFILLSFFIYNLTYWTTQTVRDPSNPSDQSAVVRLVNSLGDGLQSSGFARTAAAIGTLPPVFYQRADLAGLLIQNPQLAPRVADYPGFTSLWHRVSMQSLVADTTLTNALASGASLNEIMHIPSVQGLIADKELTKTIQDTVESNLDDFIEYLNSGKSAKYGNEPIIGAWEFNAGVTLAWLRQDQPKMAANDMRALRALWSAAYAPTKLEMTGDNQLYITGWPKFVAAAGANQPPFQGEDWKGDWSHEGTNYTLHVTLSGQDKFLTASTDGLRLRVKEGHNLLIFDHVD